MSLHFKYFSSSLISAFFILCTHALAVPPVELSDDDSFPSSVAAVSQSKSEVDRPDKSSYAAMASSIERLEHALAEVQAIAPQLQAKNAILGERVIFLETFVPWAECVLFNHSESMDEKRKFLQLCKDRVESKILSSTRTLLKKHILD